MNAKSPFPVLTAALLLYPLAGCGKKESPALLPPPALKVQLVENTGLNRSGWISVTLTASKRATMATRLAASVKKVHVMEGQRVHTGTLLVSLSDDDLQGGLKAAKTAVETATTQVKRIETLIKQNAATQAELDMASVQLAQANAALSGVKANLGYTQIRAPFSGVVQSRRVNDGDFVGPGMPLIEMEGQSEMEFTGSVSELERKTLHIGQTLSFEVEGLSGQAQITGLSTGSDPVSHRGSLRAKVISSRDGLRSGAFGRLKLPTPLHQGQELFVPKSALVQRGELNGVYVAKNGIAELRWVSLGERQGEAYAVRSGLKPGDAVIDRPENLKDGQPVEVVK